jgi:hypothetical protein
MFDPVVEICLDFKAVREELRSTILLHHSFNRSLLARFLLYSGTETIDGYDAVRGFTFGRVELIDNRFGIQVQVSLAIMRGCFVVFGGCC